MQQIICCNTCIMHIFATFCVIICSFLIAYNSYKGGVASCSNVDWNFPLVYFVTVVTHFSSIHFPFGCSLFWKKYRMILIFVNFKFICWQLYNFKCTLHFFLLRKKMFRVNFFFFFFLSLMLRHWTLFLMRNAKVFSQIFYKFFFKCFTNFFFPECCKF